MRTGTFIWFVDFFNQTRTGTFVWFVDQSHPARWARGRLPPSIIGQRWANILVRMWIGRITVFFISQFNKGHEDCAIKREYSHWCNKISQTNNGFIRPFCGWLSCIIDSWKRVNICSGVDSYCGCQSPCTSPKWNAAHAEIHSLDKCAFEQDLRSRFFGNGTQ